MHCALVVPVQVNGPLNSGGTAGGAPVASLTWRGPVNGRVPLLVTVMVKWQSKPKPVLAQAPPFFWIDRFEPSVTGGGKSLQLGTGRLAVAVEVLLAGLKSPPGASTMVAVLATWQGAPLRAPAGMVSVTSSGMLTPGSRVTGGKAQSSVVEPAPRHDQGGLEVVDSCPSAKLVASTTWIGPK